MGWLKQAWCLIQRNWRHAPLTTEQAAPSTPKKTGPSRRKKKEFGERRRKERGKTLWSSLPSLNLSGNCFLSTKHDFTRGSATSKTLSAYQKPRNERDETQSKVKRRQIWISKLLVCSKTDIGMLYVYRRSMGKWWIRWKQKIKTVFISSVSKVLVRFTDSAIPPSLRAPTILSRVQQLPRLHCRLSCAHAFQGERVKVCPPFARRLVFEICNFFLPYFSLRELSFLSLPTFCLVRIFVGLLHFWNFVSGLFKPSLWFISRRYCCMHRNSLVPHRLFIHFY